MGSISYSFEDEVVFVTGAAGGMGRAITLAFVAAGARVVAADVDDEQGAITVAHAEAIPGSGSAIFVHCDVSDDAQVADAVAEAVRQGPLKHAVNAAAIENETAPVHLSSLEQFDQMMAINVRGMFSSMFHEITAMLAGRDSAPGCAIVNLASTNSLRPQPIQPVYTTAKHAVLGLTKSAAIDYAAKGIRINAICPGSIDTPMLRNAMERRGRDPQDVINRLSLLGRFGRPEEIAEATMWLCSEGSTFTLGHALAVDAGYLAR
jgi:NAD(P)-dependent dehydrogenase (short-subunit alcohol dehydrogenase family)